MVWKNYKYSQFRMRPQSFGIMSRYGVWNVTQLCFTLGWPVWILCYLQPAGKSQYTPHLLLEIILNDIFYVWMGTARQHNQRLNFLITMDANTTDFFWTFWLSRNACRLWKPTYTKQTHKTHCCKESLSIPHLLRRVSLFYDSTLPGFCAARIKISRNNQMIKTVSGKKGTGWNGLWKQLLILTTYPERNTSKEEQNN